MELDVAEFQELRPLGNPGLGSWAERMRACCENAMKR